MLLNALVITAGLTAVANAAPAMPPRSVGTVTAAAPLPAVPARRPVVRSPHKALHAATPVRHRAQVQPVRTPVRPAPAVRRVAPRVVRRPAPVPSWSAALQAAIARIPGYPAGGARWIRSDAYGHWGTADWYHDTVYVSPRVPQDRLYDVAVHEWSHLLSVQDYAGDVPAATGAMNAWFGGTELVGAERAADCMALELGATWTHYTTCSSSTWRAGAARLLRGEQL